MFIKVENLLTLYTVIQLMAIYSRENFVQISSENTNWIIFHSNVYNNMRLETTKISESHYIYTTNYYTKLN